jgi:hypothetical protein
MLTHLSTVHQFAACQLLILSEVTQSNKLPLTFHSWVILEKGQYKDGNENRMTTTLFSKSEKHKQPQVSMIVYCTGN